MAMATSHMRSSLKCSQWYVHSLECCEWNCRTVYFVFCCCYLLLYCAPCKATSGEWRWLWKQGILVLSTAIPTCDIYKSINMFKTSGTINCLYKKCSIEKPSWVCCLIFKPRGLWVCHFSQDFTCVLYDGQIMCIQLIMAELTSVIFSPWILIQ